MDYEKRIAKASEGRKLWRELIAKYKITDKDYVVIANDEDSNISNMTLKFLPEFMAKRAIKNVYIFSSLEFYDDADLGDGVTLVKLLEDEIEAVISLYEAYEFTANIIFASLKIPNGRLGEGLLIKDDVDIEDIFKSIVYGLV
ncbi:MAG: hypothetical protein K5656_11845 [Lachnospiraceae bacterium]|nr:hypothetical protein [Lachnospiraceae bacterium]